MQIDVIIPTYERVELTRRAVDSVRAQTYPGWRVIVSDDGSSSKTLAALQDMASSDDRVTVVTGPNLGPQAARQRGYEHTSAELIATLDSDDVWDPRKLELQLKALDGFDIALCRHRWVRDGRQAKPVRALAGSGPMQPYLTTHNMSTPLIRRAALDRSGGFLPIGMRSLRNAEGVEFYCRLGQTSTYVVVPEVLVDCTSHDAVRASDDQGRTREGAQNLAYVVQVHAEALTNWPNDLAALLSRTGGRHVSSGQIRVGMRYFARSLAVAPVRQRLAIARQYGPLVAKSIVRSLGK